MANVNKQKWFRDKESDLILPSRYKRKRRLKPAAAIVLVNKAISWIDDAAHQTRTISLVVTAGNAIIVSATFGADTSGVTCTDNLGTPTVYQQQIYTYNPTTDKTVVTFWGIATASGTATITVNSTSAFSDFWRLSARQYSGVASVNALDGCISGMGAYTTAVDNATSRKRTTTNAGDAIYGVVYDASANAAVWSAGTGFGNLDLTHGFATEDLIQTTPGATAATFTAAGTGTMCIVQMLALSSSAGLGSLSNPVAFTDFETSSNGTTLTNAILTAGTHLVDVDAGVWSGSDPYTAMTVSTAGEKALLGSVIVNGVSFNDSAATRGIKFDVSVTTAQAGAFNWNHRSPFAVMAHWLFIDIPVGDTGFYSTNNISNVAGSDFASVQVSSGLMYLETQDNPNGNPVTGTKFSYTQGVWYWVSMSFDARSGKSHTMVIYDQTGVILSTQTKLNHGDGIMPDHCNYGRLGDSGTPATRAIYWDDFIFDSQIFTAIPPAPASAPTSPIIVAGFGEDYQWLGGDQY